MKNPALHQEILQSVLSERRAMIQVLEKLRAVEKSMLYAELGYSSLYQYARHELKYSEYESYHRIQAMHALQELPQAKRLLETGAVCLTSLSKLYRFCSEGAAGKEKQAELLRLIQDKSTREVDSILFNDPDDPEFEELFQKIKALYSHKHPNAKLKDLFKILAREKLQACRSVSGAARSCTYQSPVTGRVCGSRFFIEKDHIHPKSLGGTDEKSNFRDYCRQHNQWSAIQCLGLPLMQKYIPKLR